MIDPRVPHSPNRASAFGKGIAAASAYAEAFATSGPLDAAIIASAQSGRASRIAARMSSNAVSAPPSSPLGLRKTILTDAGFARSPGRPA